jgi:hypothetical protein
MVNLKEGDANTKDFDMEINFGRRRIFILRLKRGSGWVTKHDETKKTIHTHFTETMNKGPHRSRDLNWENIRLPECDLSSLADDFTKDVVHDAIKDLPYDKALGPDGFAGVFFKACWGTIK